MRTRATPRLVLTALAALAGPGALSCSDGDTLLVDLTSDGIVEHFSVQVWDVATAKQVHDTPFTQVKRRVTDAGLRIDLSFAAPGAYGVRVIGASALRNKNIVPGTQVYFFAARVLVDGRSRVEGRLLHVPSQRNPAVCLQAPDSNDDDCDGDLWPDGNTWAQHVPEAGLYAGRPGLLDCNDKRTIQVPGGGSLAPQDIHPFAPEPCNGSVDQDCDGTARMADVLTDPEHCGACDQPCSPAHVAGRACMQGMCVSTCEAGFDDCNGDLRGDGCECDLAVSVCAGGRCLKSGGQACGLDVECASLACCAGLCASATDPLNCGGCGVSCAASPAGHACIGGQCGCTANSDCGGGACEVTQVPGVKRCAPAPCGTCRVAGAAGACVDATPGTDPRSECSADPMTCRAGGCGANGACLPVPPGTICGPSSCMNQCAGCVGQYSTAVLTAADTCAAGRCGVGATSSCPGAFVCQDTTTCRTSCASDAHCLRGNACQANGTCAPLKASGVACSGASECASGVCSGTCRTCANGFASSPNLLCTPATAVCDLPSGNCTGCLMDVDCTNAGLGATCVNPGANGVCQCVTDADCTNARAPRCGNGVCACGMDTICRADELCMGESAQDVCKRRTGRSCLAATDCVSGQCTGNLCGNHTAGQPCLAPSDCTSANCDASFRCQ